MRWLTFSINEIVFLKSKSTQGKMKTLKRKKKKEIYKYLLEHP